MNPMIRKELLQRMRERRAWLLPTLYLLVLAGVVAVAYYFQLQGEETPWNRHQGADIGQTIFVAVVITQMGLLLLLAPIFSAGSLTIEKEQRTLAGLLTSLLTPLQIWWGKFVAAILFLVFLLVSSLPLLGMAFAFGGIDLGQLARAVGSTLLVIASIAAVGLLCSSLFRRSVHATSVCYGIVIALSVLTVVVFAIMESRWESSVGRTYETEPPLRVIAPLYFNPFFPLLTLVDANERLYLHPLRSVGVFAALGLLAAFFCIWTLRRSGEQV